MPLPPCSDDEYGILPPADRPHPATLSEIWQRFVAEAPEGQQRRRGDIHTVLSVHISAVRRLFTNPTIWLNGGFVTHKRWKAPRDADLVVIVNAGEFDRADKESALPLWTLADVTAQRGTGGPILVTPKLHTGLGYTDAYVVRSDRPAQVEGWRRRWSQVTGPDKQIVAGMQKGFVEVIDDD